MARSVSWRRSPSDAASWHQDQSQTAIIYILRETGPTGFLLKEEGETKKYKVFLGDPHTCTCPVFHKEKDLCKHICWVLLKKFRVPRENPLSFQLGLVEREINELLQGIAKKEQRPTRRAIELAKKAGNQPEKHATGDGREVLQQKEITEDDVCPICQDELLEKREPVTYCRYGCGKSTHIRCMKVWAEHQKSTGEVVIRCPLCREDYGQLTDLQAEYRTATLQKTRQERRDDIHMGVVCKGCNQSPITGKCYRCSQCFDFSLCHTCFSNNVHEEHSFQFRQKPTQRWRPAQRGSGAALPQAVVEDLLSRDLSEDDYDLLLQLDNDAANKPSNIPENVIKSFPTETIRQGSAMLTPGTQCRVCLRGYEIGQVVRRLPCRHKYHISCIDQWLLHEHPTCPVDGTVVWNPLTAETPRQRRQHRPQSLDRQSSTNQEVALEIPGIGVSVRHGSLDRNMARHGHQRQHVERIPGDNQEGLDPLFALTGSGISSSAYGNSGSRNTSARNPNQSSQRRGGTNRPQRGSLVSKRTDNHRTTSGDHVRLVNSMSVMGAGGNAINRQEEHTRHGDAGRLPQHGRTDVHVGNHRQNPAILRRPPAGSNSRHHSGNSQSDSAILNQNLTHHMDSLAIGNPQMASSPGRTGAAVATGGPGWRPPPAMLTNERSHVSSIPLPREAAMTPVVGNQQINMSGRSKKPPLPDGGGVGERGRRNSRSEISRRGSRSSSASGRGRERLNGGESPHRQGLDNMFLGSPTGNLVISQSASAPGSPSNRGRRSNHPRVQSKPGHSSGEGASHGSSTEPLDMALTGNRVTAPTP
ncbi:E3 ubiquitin-protein ligase ZSWIM2-like [Amphiura filiformis]|uniref:E3 ubiquitin-protein ligase ZSWIM2-like n=1 Tax=Amphiura filiformis TaxID=82378 RepID=UPI003B216B2E